MRRVKEKLGYFIQDRTADFGHSSAEDAKATLEVLKWKVRDDAE
jgi:RNA exonuclease 1